MPNRELSITDILADKIPTSGVRRTKIIATAGPACGKPEIIRDMIKAGVNVFRLNFSHGTHEEHFEMLRNIRKAAREQSAIVAILQDLSGPKIRISDVGDGIDNLENGSHAVLVHGNETINSPDYIYVPSVDPIQVVDRGDTILLADGAIVLKVLEVRSTDVLCYVEKGGRLRSRVGIAFPDEKVNLPALTDKDIRDLEWGIKNNVDYVAISFVKNSEDVINLKDKIQKLGGVAHVVSKIERKVALENIDEIIEASDSIMVARGDLGVNVPMERIPLLQKIIIDKCNRQGKPVIVATQMLQSMVKSIRPTRAEVADVSLAVLNGADAVMLSEESAIGDYPVEASSYLDRIAREAERRFEYQQFKWKFRDDDTRSVPDAVVYAACNAADKSGAKVVIACTQTGTSARLTAKYRPHQILYGASDNDTALRRMCLYWGVIPIQFKSTTLHDDEIVSALRAVQKKEKLPNGSLAVITSGLSAGKPGSTSVMEIREMNFL